MHFKTPVGIKVSAIQVYSKSPSLRRPTTCVERGSGLNGRRWNINVMTKDVQNSRN